MSDQHPQTLQNLNGVNSPNSASPVATEPPKKKRFWARLGVILGAGISAIGAVTGIISVIPILTSDSTRMDHLEISATPQDLAESEWLITPEALEAGFPVSETACSAEQLAWLEEHATPLNRKIELQMRNTAREGSMLALTDFRGNNAVDAGRADVGIRLVCDAKGVVPEQFYFGRVDVDSSEKGQHVSVKRQGPTTSATEIPITINLNPGESDVLPIELFSRGSVEGVIEVKIHSRDQNQVLQIEGAEYQVPAMLFGGDMMLYTESNKLGCYLIELGTLRECSLDEAERELEIARRS